MLCGAILTWSTACQDDPLDPAPPGIDLLVEGATVGSPGWRIRDTLKVRVVGSGADDLAGFVVDWEVLAGGGSVVPLDGVTDSLGQARALWWLGSTEGENLLEISTQGGKAAVRISKRAEAFRAGRVDDNTGFACGIVDGDAWCWGQYTWIGGQSPSVMDPWPFGWGDLEVPARVEGPGNLVSLALSDWNDGMCALDAAGGAWCMPQGAAAVSRIAGLPPLSILAPYSDGHMGLDEATGVAWMWSGNEVPTPLPGGLVFTALAGGPWLGCGLLVDSTAACWGDEAGGPDPVPVPGGLRFTEIHVGWGMGCGLEGDGDLWCWGSHLPTGNNAPWNPNPQLFASGVTDIVLGSGGVYLDAGGLMKWDNGQPAIPITLPAGLTVETLEHSSSGCLQDSGGGVYCMGELWENSTPWVWRDYFPVPPVSP